MNAQQVVVRAANERFAAKFALSSTRSMSQCAVQRPTTQQSRQRAVNRSGCALSADSTRRSPSVRPPQMPNGSWRRSAYSKHSCRTGHVEQIRFATTSRPLRWSVDSPTTGKNDTDLRPRQAARSSHDLRLATMFSGEAIATFVDPRALRRTPSAMLACLPREEIRWWADNCGWKPSGAPVFYGT
jgi:hypothetical protein